MGTAGSPVPSGTFRIRLGSVNGQILQYTVTQIAYSPGMSPPPPVSLITGTSPTAPGAVINFEFTRTGVLSSRSVAAKAVFIKAVGIPDTYLKVNATAGNRVELITSNRPSDDDGFAWIIVGPTNGVYNLYSVSTAPGTRDASRYLQSANPSTLGAIGTAPANTFVIEGLTMTPSVANATLPV
jgi:hypothetical protein